MLVSESQLAEWHRLLTLYSSLGQTQSMAVATVLQELPEVDAARAGVPVARRTARHLLRIFDDLATSGDTNDLRSAAAEAARTIRTWEQFSED